jgi:hypothetical protein
VRKTLRRAWHYSLWMLTLAGIALAAAIVIVILDELVSRLM